MISPSESSTVRDSSQFAKKSRLGFPSSMTENDLVDPDEKRATTVYCGISFPIDTWSLQLLTR